MFLRGWTVEMENIDMVAERVSSWDVLLDTQRHKLTCCCAGVEKHSEFTDRPTHDGKVLTGSCYLLCNIFRSGRAVSTGRVGQLFAL